MKATATSRCLSLSPSLLHSWNLGSAAPVLSNDCSGCRGSGREIKQNMHNCKDVVQFESKVPSGGTSAWPGQASMARQSKPSPTRPSQGQALKLSFTDFLHTFYSKQLNLIELGPARPGQARPGHARPRLWNGVLLIFCTRSNRNN